MMRMRRDSEFVLTPAPIILDYREALILTFYGTGEGKGGDQHSRPRIKAGRKLASVSRDDTARPAQSQTVVTMRYFLQRLHPLPWIDFARFRFENTKGEPSVG